MGWLLSFFKSSIGKKLLMSLTGLFLCSFLLIHLAGNFSLYIGKDAFNAYTDILSASPLIKVAEIVMVVFFVIHIFTSVQLTLENRSARPEGYAMDVSAGSRTIMSSYMFHTGSVVFIFLVLHIVTFKYGNWSNDPAMTASVGNQTLYDLVVSSFSNSIYAIAYILGMIGVGFHLNHAFQSAFQTLGLNHKKYTPLIKSFGILYSIVIAIGFASFPAYFLYINLSAGN
jgi:succinate dehydrogenase / fumarate reductase, cytochrome b subunit